MEIVPQVKETNREPPQRYVWLTPCRAASPRAMANNLWINITDNGEDGQSDLAKGAGGAYRYLKVSHEMQAEE